MFGMSEDGGLSLRGGYYFQKSRDQTSCLIERFTARLELWVVKSDRDDRGSFVPNIDDAIW